MSAPRARGAYAVRGLELAYHRWGEVAGAPVLCLHGFMDHGRAYQLVADRMPEGFCLVAPDMRGHGESGWVGAGGYYHFYDYFDDVRALLDHLGWDRFAILAHSMGGSVAAGVAAMMPERIERMVLLEGMGPPFADAADLPARLQRWSHALRNTYCDGDVAHRRAARRRMPDVGDAASRLRRANPRLGEARARQLAESFTEPAPDGAGVMWRQDPLHRTPSAKPYLRAEAESLWRRITCPVLSLDGEQSPWRPGDLDARHGCLRDVTVATMPGAGHNLHHDRPELVAETLVAWLRGAPLPAALTTTDR